MRTPRRRAARIAVTRCRGALPRAADRVDPGGGFRPRRASLRCACTSTPTAPRSSTCRPAGCRSMCMKGPERVPVRESVDGRRRRHGGCRGEAAGASLDRRPGAALGQRRCPRAHELRRHLPQHAREPGAAGRRRGPLGRQRPDREQGAAHPGHRLRRPWPGCGLAAPMRSCCTARSSTPATGDTWAFWACKDHLLLPGYAGYPNTAAASLYPSNADVADLAHANGALVGYVHPFEEDPTPLTHPDAHRCRRAAGGRGARQGRLHGDPGVLRPPGHRRGLVSAARTWGSTCRRPAAPTRWPTTRCCADRWA